MYHQYHLQTSQSKEIPVWSPLICQPALQQHEGGSGLVPDVVLYLHLQLPHPTYSSNKRPVPLLHPPQHIPDTVPHLTSELSLNPMTENSCSVMCLKIQEMAVWERRYAACPPGLEDNSILILKTAVIWLNYCILRFSDCSRSTFRGLFHSHLSIIKTWIILLKSLQGRKPFQSEIETRSDWNEMLVFSISKAVKRRVGVTWHGLNLGGIFP